MSKSKTPDIIVISDTHFGCKLALCPPKFRLDEGGFYEASKMQKDIYAMWRYFWDKYVPMITAGNDYIIVHNGDCVDGVHHQSTTQISHNMNNQRRLAKEVLRPIVNRKKCKGYYHIRGTEAHVGKSAEHEEDVAEALGAIPDEIGNHARWEMFLEMNGINIHFSHHIGTTGSTHYESSAVMREIGEFYTEAGRWGDKAVDILVRSHRHRAMKIEIPTASHYGMGLVTPGWQGKTPFTHRIPGGRVSMPQIGGIVIKFGDRVPVWADWQIWHIDRPKSIKLGVTK